MSQVTDRPTDRLLDAVKDELARRDPSLAQALLDVLLASAEPDDLDADVWGPRPSTTELLAATVRGHQLARQARANVIAASLTREQAAEALGVGQRHISTLVRDGDLVALEEAGQLRLPSWQLRPDSPKGRLEGLAEVAAAYAGGPVALTEWMLHPNPALQARTPADALGEGDLAAVLAAISAGV